MNVWEKVLVALFALVGITVSASAGVGAHELVLQISDNDPQKMNTVLNVAARYNIGGQKRSARFSAIK